jgi:nicotinamidase-related amidase
MIPIELNDKVAVLLIDYQPVYTENPNVKNYFPHLEQNFIHFITYIRCNIPSENIIHIRTNYNSTFAKNFKQFHPDKPIPFDVNSVYYACSLQNEKIIVKSSFDAFLNTTLEKYLKERNIDTLIVCGLLTSVCVLFSTQSAFSLGYKVYLYQQACADRSLINHNFIIKLYKNYIFHLIPDDFIFYVKN